ncbi:TetR/AcrR family transcriptional regulator [Streptosporangium sp. NBC_01756]|uniref:TetR/AcrR family transcriptional regulator n=1 Tax=Streptosporangium sp. NBC_01756 TaxID=2975950 RepID=UPI002DD877A0|nr:TetR/AcrR family transcriptional regulator [Streptosporangium sp. NBC_01756]WSC87689.1 TetR/AcrR family transcriptional regulator [Streptosporangium sp. NBC_01756]
MTEATTGRRERKKARTRQAIADAALELFLERGFDQVAVKDVAEAADVSMSGLFKHFPTKESLVFDEEDDVQAGLISSVRDRPEGTSVLEALRAWLLARVCNKSADPRVAEFLDLVAHTPALSDYARRMWLRHEEELAKAIRQSGPDAPGADIAARAVARFVLDRTQPWQRDDPRAELDAAFTLLTHGRPAPELHATPHPPPSAAPPSPARPSGLRERKKAQTRQAITTTALELFAAHGYDNVGVREIADAAGTSIATLFTYFPDGKASLVFPGDRGAHVAALVRAVRLRSPGQTILRALHDHMAERGPFKSNPTPDERRVLDLIRATPELRDYALHSWTVALDPLTAAITQQAALPADDLTARLLARYVLQIPDLAAATADARRTLDVVTGLLERGWPAGLTDGHPHTTPAADPRKPEHTCPP